MTRPPHPDRQSSLPQAQPTGGTSHLSSPPPLADASFIGHHQQIDRALHYLQQASLTFCSESAEGPDLPAPDLISALSGVKEAAAEHFAHEEKLMEDTGFDQTDEHRQTHRFFLTLIQMEMDALLRGKPVQGDPLCQTLQSWLIAHSRHQDAELALFLCRGGPDLKLSF